jgi:hypothetical protein
MEGSTPITGKGKTPDKAQDDAAKNAGPGKYEVTITGTVEKDARPQPNPIGEYKAEFTPSN